MHAIIEHEEFDLSVEYKIESYGDGFRGLQFTLEAVSRTDDSGFVWDLRVRDIPRFRSNNDLALQNAIWRHIERQEALVLAQMQEQRDMGVMA